MNNKELNIRKGLPNFFSKLKKEKKATVVFFGGSITQQRGYRDHLTVWFKNEYPDTDIQSINSGIGGTGSDIGNYRIQRDVLDKNPDLVFIEFAVNDGGKEPVLIYETMEGLVRRIYKNNPETDICFIYTIMLSQVNDLQAGKIQRSASAMEKIADHYNIPSINMGVEVVDRVNNGKLIFESSNGELENGVMVFSADGTHPLAETGHKIYQEVISKSLKKMESTGKPFKHILKTPYTKSNWEFYKSLSPEKCIMSDGWEKVETSNDHILKQFSRYMTYLHKSNVQGASITFKFKGRKLGIYDKSGPDSGQLKITIDNEESIILNRFTEMCYIHRITGAMLRPLEDKVHTVKIEVYKGELDKAALLAKRNKRITDPEEYAGRYIYLNKIIIDGELLSK